MNSMKFINSKFNINEKKKLINLCKIFFHKLWKKKKIKLNQMNQKHQVKYFLNIKIYLRYN